MPKTIVIGAGVGIGRLVVENMGTGTRVHLVFTTEKAVLWIFTGFPSIVRKIDFPCLCV